MNKLAITLTLLSSLFLSGCQTDEEMAAQQAAQFQNRVAENRNICTAYGFTPNTPRFAECMQQTEMHRQEIDQRRLAATLGAYTALQSRTTQPTTINVCQADPGQVNTCSYH